MEVQFAFFGIEVDILYSVNVSQIIEVYIERHVNRLEFNLNIVCLTRNIAEPECQVGLNLKVEVFNLCILCQCQLAFCSIRYRVVDNLV